MENNKLDQGNIEAIIRYRDAIVPFVSGFTNTKQLTMCSLVWNFVIILSGIIMFFHPHRAYLWLVIASLILHNITDSLDGAVGRYKEEGYVKWGYVMDHLFDTITVLTTCFAIICFLYAKGNHTAFIPLFFIMGCMVSVMTFSFLSLNSFGGLQMSVCLYDDSKDIGHLCINVLHSIYMMIAFMVYIWACDGHVSVPVLTFAATLFCVLTVWHVYRKQRVLSHLDETARIDP